MLHSSRNRLESKVCRSLRKAARYWTARVWRCLRSNRAMVFSYYYYRFSSRSFTARLARRRRRNQEGKPSPSRLAGAGWSER